MLPRSVRWEPDLEIPLAERDDGNERRNVQTKELDDNPINPYAAMNLIAQGLQEEPAIGVEPGRPAWEALWADTLSTHRSSTSRPVADPSRKASRPTLSRTSCSPSGRGRLECPWNADFAASRGSGSPNRFSIDCNVVRLRPSRAAAPRGPPITQPVSSRTRATYARSTPTSVSSSLWAGRGGDSTGSGGRVRRPPGDRITARWITFSSSRTFPGHGW